MEEHLYQEFYDIENVHWWFTARRTILITFLRRNAGRVHALKLLDVGCGTGAILADALRYFDAHGIDASTQAIEFCRKRGLRNLFLGNLAEYPMSTAFDIITLLDVVEHIDDDLEVLRQAHARLKDGGHALITVPAYQWLWSSHDIVNHHKRRYTRTQLGNVVAKAGFHIERITYFNTLLFPLALLRRVLAKLASKQQSDDFLIPPAPVNAVLSGVFRLEQYIVPHLSLPFGLSVLCWATKNRI